MELSADNLSFIDKAMETTNNKGQVNMYWYVQSYFGNALEGEIKKTKGWEITYLK